jgi:ATP-dependent Clp protease ATP-binding subunit ClpC
VFERYTEGARHVVVLAQDEARGFGHGSIGTEHLLLGLVREGKGIAARALDALDVTVEKVRHEVEVIVGHSDETIPPGQIRFSLAAQKALERSLRDAVFFGDDNVATEHLLLGVLHDTDGITGRVLAALGLTPEAVRSETIRTLKEPATEEQTRRWVMAFLEHAADSIRTAKELAIDTEEAAQAAEIGQIEASLRQLLRPTE